MSQTPRPYRLAPDGDLVPSSDSPEAYVEQALHAAKSGSAGHWPTVAAVLHDEVFRLRAELERERNPNVELSLANQSAFSASLAAVQARYADGFKLQRDAARAELAALRAQQATVPADAVGQVAARVHDVLCDCHDNGTGLMIRSLDLDKVRAGIAPLIESWRPATEPAEASCACYSCQESTFPEIIPGVRSQPFPIVCAECGNKRCPHATDHRNACTGSNASGQAGSNYAPLTAVPTEGGDR